MGDDKFTIAKFDGSNFGWWKVQIEALLGQKDLDCVLEEKPAGMDEKATAAWNAKDKRARGVIMLSVTMSVGQNLLSQTTARGMIEALSNTYEKPSVPNKVFLMRQLFLSLMKEGESVTEHVDKITSILNRLDSVGLKYDEEMRALLLLSSLPDSWSATVTAITNSMTAEAMTFEKMRDLVLGENLRRQSVRGSTSEMLHMGRGNSRGSGSGKNRGRSSSRSRSKTVRCWDCGERGHVRTECPDKTGKAGKGNELVCTVDGESDDALLLSEVVSTNTWVVDSGASLHATHSSEGMRNVRFGDFGEMRLGTGEVLKVTGLGDIDLKTGLGTTWTLKGVRIVPRLKTSLISVSQLDKLGMRVSFGNGNWKVIKGNLVIAKGSKASSLYTVSIPSGRLTAPIKTSTKIRFADSESKRVEIVTKDTKAFGNQLEHHQRSEHKRVSGDSGSTDRVPTRSGIGRWVQKTDLSSKFFPDELLVGSVPLFIPASECLRLWSSVGIEDGLRPAEASTGPRT